MDIDYNKIRKVNFNKNGEMSIKNLVFLLLSNDCTTNHKINEVSFIFPDIIFYVKNPSKSFIFRVLTNKSSFYRRVVRSGILKVENGNDVFNVIKKTGGNVINYLSNTEIQMLSKQQIREILHNKNLYGSFLKRLNFYDPKDKMMKFIVESSPTLYTLKPKYYDMDEIYNAEKISKSSVLAGISQEIFDKRYNQIVSIIKDIHNNIYNNRLLDEVKVAELLYNKNIKLSESQVKELLEIIDYQVLRAIPTQYLTEEVILNWIDKNADEPVLLFPLDNFPVFTEAIAEALIKLDTKLHNIELTSSIKKLFKSKKDLISNFSDSTQLLIKLKYDV